MDSTDSPIRSGNFRAQIYFKTSQIRVKVLKFFIRNNPFSSGHNEGILDILIDQMNPVLNQYYIQLQKYNGHHYVVDQNENQMNRWHSRKQLELVARKYVMENGSKNDSKLTRRKKYIRTMKRIQK